MAEELAFKDEAAAEYDRAFAHVTAYFMPFLLRAAHIAPGMRVLDIATGTGLSAEEALAAVGPPAMSAPLMSRRPWPRRRASVLAKRRMPRSRWRMGRRFRSRIAVTMPCCAISG
jgi:hypothetical protein